MDQELARPVLGVIQSGMRDIGSGDATAWAKGMFGAVTLGDARLDRRLVKYAAAQADSPTASTAKACGSVMADREGAYRLLENKRVEAKAIDEGPYAHCASACAGKRQVLAIQDTTSVQVHHVPLAEQLREEGSPTGFVVHTLLIADEETQMPLGIADQRRWIREKGRPGKATRKERRYADKESSKWENALDAARARLPADVAMISVCDREADIYELLAYHAQNELDFVIRASWNRRTADEIGCVFEAARTAPVVGHRSIRIEQRGATKNRKNRKRRDVELSIQATTVALKRPKNRPAEGPAMLRVHVVRVTETTPEDGSDALEWLLLTSLPIATADDVNRVVAIYEMRWLIEQFFKCWKTGCRLESRPLQSLDAVERMMAITAPIGVRLLQLQLAAAAPDADIRPTEMTDDEWRCLWAATSREPIPDFRPTARWAYRAVAKLGGWYDSKRTGRAGWQTLWEGWQKLQLLLQGWLAARRSTM